MKKMLIFAAVLLGMATEGRAQNEVGRWTVTPRVGLNVARLTDPDIYIGADPEEKIEHGSKRGLLIGAEAEYQWNSVVALSGALFYSAQGTCMKDNSAFRDAKTTIDYVNVPLTAKLYFNRGVAFRTGVQLGFAVKRHVEGYEMVESEAAGAQWRHYSSSDTWYRTFDLSIPLGLSANLGRFQVDASYNLGVTNAAKFEALKVHNRVLQLTIGYRFEL